MSGLLVGFARWDATTAVPDGLSIVAVGNVAALLADEARTLPSISTLLLKMQETAAVVPLRPSSVPPNLTAHIARMADRLADDFVRLTDRVEFVVSAKVHAIAETYQLVVASDYLRRTLQAQRRQQDDIAKVWGQIARAIATLERDNQSRKVGERSLNGFAAIHYLMDRNLVEKIVDEWRTARAALVGAPATLFGPWAPYSFATIEG